MSVDAANPGRGDVAGIIAASRERSRKAGTVRDAAAVVDTSVVEASGSGWVGLAREAFVDAAETLAADLRVTADRLDAEAAAYAAYGRGVQEVQDAQRVLELRRAELTADLAQPISEYSHGMKQKLAIISALLHEPKLILMDEPFVGLDPTAAYQLKTIMREHCDRGGAIFFSTHVLEVAEKLCDKVAIIKGGRLIASGTMEEVKGDQSLEDVFLELEGEGNV